MSTNQKTFNRNIISTDSQFRQTRNMLVNSLQIDKLSYDDWSERPNDQKAVLLFVNFYEQIELAWYKVRGEHTYEEDGVSEALNTCSYLCGLSLKSGKSGVSKINKNSYTPNFIFTAMKNAFNSLNYERKSTRSQYQHPNDEITVCSQYSNNSDGDDLDLFQFVGDRTDTVSVIESNNFWSLIEDMDLDTQEVVDRLINGERIRKDQEKIVEKLREKLAQFSR